MNILLGFAPYIVFFLFMRWVSVEAALWAALIAAVLNAGREFARSRSIKLLEIGNVVLFAALPLLTSLFHWNWTVMTLRLAVDSGLLLIVLVSLAIGQPFTLQYARERVPREHWRSPLFLSINRRITWAWAIAFAVLVLMHAAVVFQPKVPWWLDVLVTLLALVSALRFTARYPAQARKKAGVGV